MKTSLSEPKEQTSNSLNYDGGLTCAMGVKNLEKSIAWYQDVLGFQLLYKMDQMGWCELSTSVQRVNIGLSQVESPKGRGGATLTFGVKDIDAARQQVEGKNVKFDGETQVFPGMVKLATFFDPDGNTLMFYQDLQKHP